MAGARGLTSVPCISRGARALRSEPAQRPAPTRVMAASAYQQQTGFTERILRYPDGMERRIRYPMTAEQEDAAFQTEPYRSFDESRQPDRWGPQDWDVSDLWAGYGSGCDTPSMATAMSSPAEAPFQQEAVADPMAFLEQLTSSSYKEAQERFWGQIGSSYQILDGSPWVLPKPLHVLVLPQLASPQPAMFTLQTRLPQSHMEDELSRVLGRRQADGSHLISVDRRVEGVVAFEDELAAEQFGDALEAQGHEEVSLATCNSHQLFRLTSDSAAVVVLFCAGAQLPTPGELEVSLRRKQNLSM